MSVTETANGNSSTTTYHYDPNTGAFSGFNNPNGSTIRYLRDVLGRVTEVTTTAPNGTAQTTQYRYDGNSNPIEVTEPNIGTTTLTYDGVNRLAERTLPNNIKTIYTYKENTDFIESITHYAADGTTVLSSVEYVRNPGGEPSRIIREDGSYVTLQYDDSLRLEKETYYDAAGNLTDETTYTYDAAGNRQSASNGEAQGTYIYDNTHQLTGINTNSGTETYTYDEGGRVEQVVRDGETLNLFYNSDDLIVKVTDASNNTVVEYGYDSNGRRVEMSDSTGEKNYLVAPNLGEGLDSPHLVSDAAGNPLASYVYAGEMPLMRLDAQGNPTYYLEDGMGSVIGLADGTGSQVTGFQYDSFGNLRTPEGLPAELGGDFRFQGQWLESNTDFYHMRARYYDPEVGRFISRDPVDLIEYEPESSNPYQFVYNNPLIYSDPTGEFTLATLNANMTIQDTLSKVRTHAANQTKDYLVNKIQEVVSNQIGSFLESILPTQFINLGFSISKYEPGKRFEKFAQHALCAVMGEGFSAATSWLWLEPKVSVNGEPITSGYNCHNILYEEEQAPLKYGGRKAPEGFSYPDYIVKKSSPLDETKDKGFLIGDFKYSVKRMYENYVESDSSKQWKSIVNYARYSNGHMYVPITFFIAFTTSKREYPGWIKALEAEAIQKGVVMQLLTLT